MHATLGRRGELEEKVARQLEKLNNTELETILNLIKLKLFPNSSLEEYHGKVTSSLFGKHLVTKEGDLLRFMYRGKIISTHDERRGIIPFKDHALALNHNYWISEMRKQGLPLAQLVIPGLSEQSPLTVSKNLKMIPIEMVLRGYMARSSTSTSMYQHWLRAEEEGRTDFSYAGREWKCECTFTQLQII